MTSSLSTAVASLRCSSACAESVPRQGGGAEKSVSAGRRAVPADLYAAPMVGGMISSTILTLIVIPAIYALVKERRLGR